jgi:hypothetical protein
VQDDPDPLWVDSQEAVNIKEPVTVAIRGSHTALMILTAYSSDLGTVTVFFQNIVLPPYVR